MKALMLFVAVMLLGTASAQTEPRDYLEGGAFIAHVVPELIYTQDPPPNGWCASYAPFAIHSCEEQNNRVDVSGSAPVTWYVLAAWLDGEKQWCGCEFGFGQFDPGLFSFFGHSPCFPQQGLELPTSGWPGPNEGTAIVAAGPPWSGNFEPVYFFGGYAYEQAGPGVIPLGVDPTTSFAGFSNCTSPVESWPAQSLGGLGINTEGIYACPTPYVQRACCFGDSCALLTYLECSAAGGGWLEEYDACEPAPSPCQTLPLRACCLSDTSCVLTIIEQCDELGGWWHQALDFCDPNPCGPQPHGVCCIGGECEWMDLITCFLIGGQWHPEWVSCYPNPCQIVPVETVTWGRIKALYRAK